MAVAGNAGRAREEKPAAPSSPEGPTSAEKENEEDEFEVSARAAAAAALELDELVGGDADIAYEQELRRDPYQVKVWLAYLKSRAKAKPAIR